MKITFDPVKRDLTLARRGLAFEEATKVFASRIATIRDRRLDYEEARYQTFGLLDDRVVVVVWTPRSGSRRVISMRYANERESSRLGPRLDRPG